MMDRICIIRIIIVFPWISYFYSQLFKNLFRIQLMKSIPLIFLFIVLSSSMFAPRRERMMQTISLTDQIFEAPTFEMISFNDFMQSLNKKYRSSSQEMYRLLVYNENIKLIQSHNIAAKQTIEQKKKTYTMEINQFSDLTQKQFRRIYTKTYPTDQVVVQKTTQVINAVSKEPILCKDCNQPTQDQNQQVNDTSKPVPSPLDLKILEIVQQSQQRKEQSSTKLDKLLEKLGQKICGVVQVVAQPIIKVAKIVKNLKKAAFNKIINSRTKKTQIDAPMPMDKSRLLQATNQAGNIEIDWTLVSGAIKYQGVCGSCYAFATVDAVSAMYAIYKFGFNVPLSVQQIVDCPQNGLTFGCGGGFLEGAYAYIQTNGVTTNFQYKYTGKQQTCKVNNGTFKIQQFKTLSQGNCNSLIQELQKKPIAVGIAGYRLKFYSSGVFDDCNDYIDHAVLLVGYKSGVGWKIKNSWGAAWGMNGYAWIKEGNTCGMCQNAVSATIAEESASQTASTSGNVSVRPNIDQKLGTADQAQQQTEEAGQSVEVVKSSKVKAQQTPLLKKAFRNILKQPAAILSQSKDRPTAIPKRKLIFK